MHSQAELILRVITFWFLVLSHFLETVWVPLKVSSLSTFSLRHCLLISIYMTYSFLKSSAKYNLDKAKITLMTGLNFYPV